MSLSLGATRSLLIVSQASNGDGSIRAAAADPAFVRFTGVDSMLEFSVAEAATVCSTAVGCDGI